MNTLWITLYWAAIDNAASNGFPVYSSRIDGALFPWRTSS
jgi:hypothetical protein